MEKNDPWQTRATLCLSKIIVLITEFYKIKVALNELETENALKEEKNNDSNHLDKAKRDNVTDAK